MSSKTAAYIATEEEFDALITGESLVVVDFTATWCGPCKMVGPRMDELAQAYDGRLQVFKVDLDAHANLAKRFGIRSIPSVTLFKGGKTLTTLVGAKPYEEYAQAVDQYL